MRIAFWTALVLGLAVQSSAVILPIELKAPTPLNKSVVSKKVTVRIPTGLGKTVQTFHCKVHNLSYDAKMTVQIGTAQSITVTNTSVSVLGLGKTYGGIGGSFSTLDIEFPVKPVPDGLLNITFRFNGTDGISSGVDILVFNLRGPPGTPDIIPAGQFTKEDPSKWTAPLPSATDIAAGLKLWHEAKLLDSPLNKNGIPETCGDCHAQDGRDLKYYNYSNTAIIARAQFHGLTNTQGKQIASYIRTLALPAPGRPWNPPYQPGPGLDNKSWAAGAGLEWVLPADIDTLPYLFPSGIDKAAIAVTKQLNVRELPVSLQFPDWNHWLPRRHPKDTWGAQWSASEIPSRYEALRAHFADTGALPAYLASPNSKADINTWQLRENEFLVPRTEDPSIVWTRAYAEGVYGSQQWMAVKMWEMEQEFGLDGYGSVYFGQNPQVEKRTWFDRICFKLAPFQLKIPDTVGAVGTGDGHTIALVNEYLSSTWYHVQLVLNPGNGTQWGTTPIDWGYSWGKFKDTWDATRTETDQIGSGELARYTAYFVKGTQEWAVYGKLDLQQGWNPVSAVTIDWPAKPTPLKQWLNVPPTTKGQVLSATMGAWLDYSMRFTTQQWIASGWVDPLYVPHPDYNGNLGDRWLYMLGSYPSLGVDAVLLDKCSRWCATLWPLGKWPVAVGTGSQ